MGLLDDAIREHLELKRRAGADPGELARVEREALDPSFEPDGAAGVAVGLHSDERPDAGDHTLVNQETAELDMATVLHEDPMISLLDRREAEPSPGPADGDSLEWEMPMRAAGSAWAPSSPREYHGNGARQATEEAWRGEAQPVHAGLDREPALPEQLPGQERFSLD